MSNTDDHNARPPRREGARPAGQGRPPSPPRGRPAPRPGQPPRPNGASGTSSASGTSGTSGQPPRPPKRPRPPAVDVDALLAHANAPDTDLLAEAEAEIAADIEREAATTPGMVPAVGDLTDIATLRRLLRKHDLRPNKSFGQNFLVNREVLETIVAAAALQPEDNVLEVGSGTGVLTIELARRAHRVVAVELDRAILPVLQETTAHETNVEIIPRDLLDVQPDVVFGEQPYKLVANLPYYITALTLRHFLEAVNPPRVFVVMVQWEVARRLTAEPGDLSLLGLSVQFYGAPRILARVPAASFFPAPQVDSAVVRVDLYPQPLLPPDERDDFFRLAHAGFAEKRKQVHNSLARNLHLPQETVARWLAETGIDPMRRAESLSMDEWVRLTRVFRAEKAG